MKTQHDLDRVALVAMLAILCAGVLLVNLYSVDVLSSTYNDNTTIISRLNVTNVAPVVDNMLFYKKGIPSGNNIVLEEGTTINVRCNGTVNDSNGIADLSAVNATIFFSAVTDSEDNNWLYNNASCHQISQISNIAAFYSCNFEVWYYANNGTWDCNMTAIDTGDLRNSTQKAKAINPLYAINLSGTEIDFGELEPNQISAADEELNVTNSGNMNLTIALRAYGETLGDNWAMNCTVGNISLTYERYSINSGSLWSAMTAVPAAFSNIAGLVVHQKVDDADTGNLKSTNSTFWKIKAPFGTRGVCNGTIVLSAKV